MDVVLPRAGARTAGARQYSLPSRAAVGVQIGVEGVDLVMVIQNERGMRQLLSSRFELGADASAAVGPVGRHTSADTDWKIDAEILTYSRARGAFAGLTLNGASIRHDEDSTRAIYGHNVTNQRILQGEVNMPASACSLLDAVRGAKAQAIASNWQRAFLNISDVPGGFQIHGRSSWVS